MFETKIQAEQEARKKNGERVINPKTGKLPGSYKVYEGKNGDKCLFAVAKSPAGASAHLLTGFGIDVTGDKKAIVTKMKPKDYIALCDAEELAELEKEWAVRKAA